MKGKRLVCPGAISCPTIVIDGHAAVSAAIPFEAASNASRIVALRNGRLNCHVTMCEFGVVFPAPKDGQSVPVGVGQPTLKIDALTVGGTQA
jgi:hypothetical protein